MDGTIAYRGNDFNSLRFDFAQHVRFFPAMINLEIADLIISSHPAEAIMSFPNIFVTRILSLR